MGPPKRITFKYGLQDVQEDISLQLLAQHSLKSLESLKRKICMAKYVLWFREVQIGCMRKSNNSLLSSKLITWNVEHRLVQLILNKPTNGFFNELPKQPHAVRFFNQMEQQMFAG